VGHGRVGVRAGGQGSGVRPGNATAGGRARPGRHGAQSFAPLRIMRLRPAGWPAMRGARSCRHEGQARGLLFCTVKVRGPCCFAVSQAFRGGCCRVFGKARNPFPRWRAGDFLFEKKVAKENTSRPLQICRRGRGRDFSARRPASSKNGGLLSAALRVSDFGLARRCGWGVGTEAEKPAGLNRYTYDRESPGRIPDGCSARRASVRPKAQDGSLRSREGWASAILIATVRQVVRPNANPGASFHSLGPASGFGNSSAGTSRVFRHYWLRPLCRH